MGGYFDGDYRFSANFRQQWWAAGAPFVTSTAGYDTKLMPTKIPEHDIFSVGVMGLYDQSLSGGFKSVDVSANVSYNRSLNEDGQNNDINAGLLYAYKTDNTEVYVGASMFHIGNPNISFLKDQRYRLPSRYTVHAGSRFVVGDNGNELFLGGLYMYQAGATEKNFGIAYGLSVSDEATVYAGSWYRIGDAILPYVGLRYNGFQVGFSYDVINTALKNYGTKKNGSFELSMNLLVTRPRNVYTNYKGGRIF